MGYVNDTLGADEDYVYRARLNWTYDVASWSWFALSMVPLGVWRFVSIRAPDAQTGSMATFAIIACTIGAFLLLSHYIVKWTTVIGLTSSRLILKKGVIAREAEDINLRNIEEVELRQSFFGRLCLFGRLVIRGSGIGVIELPMVDRPVVFRKKIEEAVITARKTHAHQ